MDREQALTREHIQRGMRDYERGCSRNANPCVGVTARAEWFEGFDNAKGLAEQDRQTDAGLTMLRPETEGECVMTLCRRIGGELHYEQHRFSAQEMRSAVIYTEMKIELSSMLARLERAHRDASRGG